MRGGPGTILILILTAVAGPIGATPGEDAAVASLGRRLLHASFVVYFPHSSVQVQPARSASVALTGLEVGESRGLWKAAAGEQEAMTGGEEAATRGDAWSGVEAAART
jgi:hypothetical protein